MPVVAHGMTTTDVRPDDTGESAVSLIILYSGPLSMFGAKAEIALLEKGQPFELVMVPFNKADRYEPKHPEVLKINPKGQVPVLVHARPEGSAVELFDSTLIF